MTDRARDKNLTCFKFYDILGKLSEGLNKDIVHGIGRSLAQVLQSTRIVIGYDVRETYPVLANEAESGVQQAGATVLDIGLLGTVEMYWAVTSQQACAGIEDTASHHPFDYNLMTIVKRGSEPMSNDECQAIPTTTENLVFVDPICEGAKKSIETLARQTYIEELASLVSPTNLKPLTIVVHSGNGAAEAEFIRVHYAPDPPFPNGTPNPLVPENHAKTVDLVREVSADFGVAFDGDLDCYFLFDEKCDFMPGAYLTGP